MKNKILLLFFIVIFIFSGCSKSSEPTVIDYTDYVFRIVETQLGINEDTLTATLDMDFPKAEMGHRLTWTSDSDYLTDDGKVTRPNHAEDDAIANLTLKVSKGSVIEKTKTYQIIIPAKSAEEAGITIVNDERTSGSALLISGGNSTVYLNQIDDKFIALGGGNQNINIAIIPTAGGSLSSASSIITDYKKKYGLDDSQFSVINALTRSDGYANDDAEVEKINKATAVFFTGGDQDLIVTAFKNADGTSTKVLQAIYDNFNAGNFVIGGSSAGAAIMSEIMISRGFSFGALTYPHLVNGEDYYVGSKSNEDVYYKNSDHGVLMLNKNGGLGFFKHGVIDQHFYERDRIGRLLEAVFYEEQAKRIGFGIAEGSAMIFDNTTKEISVIGEMAIIDCRDAVREETAEGLTKITNAKLSILRQGSTYNVDTNTFAYKNKSGIDLKAPTSENYFKYPTNNGDLFSSQGTSLHDFIGEYVLTNYDKFMFVGRENMKYASGYQIEEHTCFNELYPDYGPVIFETRFYIDESITKGYYDNTIGEYSYQNVVLDIIPLDSSLNPIDAD